jgi:hypothetical protein
MRHITWSSSPGSTKSLLLLLLLLSLQPLNTKRADPLPLLFKPCLLLLLQLLLCHSILPPIGLIWKLLPLQLCLKASQFLLQPSCCRLSVWV